jgi:hypothetical protein
MINEREVERAFLEEFRDLMPHVIWQSDDGVYQVFGRYRIQAESAGFRVFCSATDAGVFSTTRTALSWCIADKNQAYNTARELLETDHKLAALTADIATRAAIGDRSRDPALRETILTKLESKIIHKKHLENQLTKYVSWAKYCQQRGFEDETARTGRGQPNKTSRQGI